MLEVFAQKDCGNSSKKLLLKNFYIVFVEKRIDELFLFLSEDIIWNTPKGSFLGHDQIHELISDAINQPVQKLFLDQIITHGKDAAVRGKFTLGEKTKYFSDFYEFQSAGSKKIKTINSYIGIL